MSFIQIQQDNITLSKEAPNWAKRRWQDLVVKEKTYTPSELANRLMACVGFNPEWIVRRNDKNDVKNH